MATYTEHGTYGRSTGGHGGWSIADGVLLLIVGVIAIAVPLLAQAIILPSVVLLITGIALIIAAVRDRSFGGVALGLALGLLAIIAAAWLFLRPVIGILSLQMILSGYFLIAGILQVIAAIAYRGEGWAWVLISGVAHLALAALLFFGVFGESLLIASIYLGISVLFTGIALLVQGWGHRRYETSGRATGTFG